MGDGFDSLLEAFAEDLCPRAPKVDRFELGRCLGEGGFGAVYESVDRADGRTVAVKVLRRMTPDALYRFKREFRSLVDVRHENLVRLHELVHEDGRWMLSMELVDGVPFDRALAAQPDALRPLFGQLASALRAIHRAGKIHRDIKSSNVLVTNSRVVVLDFGLVRELADAETTVVAGTPHYMSPEQFDRSTLTSASDWYSFGVMLYRALNGRWPFDDEPGARRTRAPDRRRR